MIRKATVHDVKAIHALLKLYGDQGHLLPRALSDLYDSIRDFTIFQDQDQGGVVGICALHICWEDLAEIRSLAVEEKYQRRGIGSILVGEAVKEAHGLGIPRVFTLTYRPGFFERHGFQVVDKATLPQKVWADCIKCVKFPDCDEIAMIRSVEELEKGLRDGKA
jgi:amino-acid N-acetyltransferase